MATVQDIIDRSLRLLGLYDSDSGVTPSTVQRNEGLIALNNMLDGWSNEELLITDYTTSNVTLATGTTSYTIGSGGTFNVARPLELISAALTDGTLVVPLEILRDIRSYRQINTPSLRFRPVCVYYDPSFPLGTLFFYGTPDANYPVTLDYTAAITQLASLATTVTLPPGWERAITYNLALELAPEFIDLKLAPQVETIARESKAGIKRVNHKPPEQQSALVRRSNYNIFSDTYE